MSSRTRSFTRSLRVLVTVVAAACTTDSPVDPSDLSVVPVSEVGGVPRAQATAALAAVIAGNTQSIAAAPSLVPPGAPLAPFIEARLYAIANVAMHDALNAIVPRFERY